MDVASFLGDIAHLTAILLLLGTIAYRKSCEGISGRTQLLYATVFTTRYLDLLDAWISPYLILMKILFIVSSYLTVLLIYYVYRKTSERQYDKFWSEILVIVCLGLGLILADDISMPEEVLYVFSRYLEAFLIIPQLYFTFKKELKSNVITYYVIALILYRGFYIAHWIIRYRLESYYKSYLVVPGVIQFILYFSYFFIANGESSDILSTVGEQFPGLEPTTKRPKISRQESLLETPFLKRNAASYTSVYTIELDSQNLCVNGLKEPTKETEGKI